MSVGNKPKAPEKPKNESGYRRYEHVGRLDDWKSTKNQSSNGVQASPANRHQTG
jgi:hypothetical protein